MTQEISEKEIKEIGKRDEPRDEMPQNFVSEKDSGFEVAGGFLNNVMQISDRIVVKPRSSRVNEATQRLDLDMNNASAYGGAYINRLITFTSGDATPSVKNANMCITAGTTAITDFDDGVVGQEIKIKATANITITDGSPITLAGAADYSMTADDTLTLAMFDDQVWHELNRSVN